MLLGSLIVKLFAKLGTSKDGVKLELMQRQKGDNDENYEKLFAALKTKGVLLSVLCAAELRLSTVCFKFFKRGLKETLGFARRSL